MKKILLYTLGMFLLAETAFSQVPSNDSLFERLLNKSLAKGLTQAQIDYQYSGIALIKAVVNCKDSTVTISTINKVPDFTRAYIHKSLKTINFSRFFPDKTVVVIPLFLIYYPPDKRKETLEKEKLKLEKSFLELDQSVPIVEAVRFVRPIKIYYSSGRVY